MQLLRAKQKMDIGNDLNKSNVMCNKKKASEVEKVFCPKFYN